eukprot:GHVS01089638.1.p1 GENE.GHVS01089638.1~~GHVS01089638.1.p1  ORF type:complete len:250 (+),score=47.85 GHVS01089638.1:206-955(+)
MASTAASPPLAIDTLTGPSSLSTASTKTADCSPVAAVANASGKDEEEAGGVKELPLQHIWHIWEQVVPQKDSGDYSENTKAIASFRTVQEFWRLWNHMPQPSELLNSKRMVREADDALHLVDALMIFKEGVEPMWEDAVNARGGHFEYKLNRSAGGDQIDEYWNNLVLGMIGGNLEEGGIITGVRLVDKLNSGRGGQGCIRIEVWFTNFDDNKSKEELKKAVETCMATGMNGVVGQLPHGDTKSHKSHK